MGKAFNSVQIVAGRIAGAPTFTPSYLKPGSDKPIGPKCDVTIYQNIRDRKHTLKLTAWGGLAIALARGGATGKELTIAGRIDSYMGCTWYAPDAQGNMNFVTNPDGSPLLTNKIGITVEKLDFGNDSAKTIVEEINAGARPLNYAVPGHAEEVQWKQMCAQRNAEQYVPNNPTFGFAKCYVPDGVSIVAAPVAANAAAGNAGTAQFAQNVAAQKVAPIVAAPVKPVVVHNQNMGYAVDNAQTVDAPVVVM